MAEPIDLYFEAINGLKIKLEARGTSAARQRSLLSRVGSVGVRVLVVLIALTIIPVVPLAVTAILPAGHLGPLPVGGSDLTPFLMTWLVLGLGAVAVGFALAWTDGRSPALTEGRRLGPLTPEQLTFWHAYSAARELDLFLASGVAEHADKALRLARELAEPGLVFQDAFTELGGWEPPPFFSLENERWEMLVRDFNPPGLAARLRVLEQTLDLADREHWLELTPASLARVRCLVSLPSRLLPSLELKQDLPRVRDALRALAAFSFSFLPDRQGTVEPGALESQHSAGVARLDQLVQIVGALPSLEVPKPTRPERKKRGRVDRLYAWFRGPTSGARFLRWCGAIFPITGIAIGLIGQAVALTPETVVYVIVPTTILGAATLTAIRAGSVDPG